MDGFWQWCLYSLTWQFNWLALSWLCFEKMSKKLVMHCSLLLLFKQSAIQFFGTQNFWQGKRSINFKLKPPVINRVRHLKCWFQKSCFGWSSFIIVLRNNARSKNNLCWSTINGRWTKRKSKSESIKNKSWFFYLSHTDFKTVIFLKRK